MSAANYTPDDARRDLRWLHTVRAVRSWSEPTEASTPEPSFTVVTFAGTTLTLAVPDVRVFRAGVLVGWRLPREQVPA